MDQAPRPGYVADNSITNRAMPYVGPVVTGYTLAVVAFVAWLVYNEYKGGKRK